MMCGVIRAQVRDTFLCSTPISVKILMFRGQSLIIWGTQGIFVKNFVSFAFFSIYPKFYFSSIYLIFNVLCGLPLSIITIMTVIYIYFWLSAMHSDNKWLISEGSCQLVNFQDIKNVLSNGLKIWRWIGHGKGMPLYMVGLTSSIEADPLSVIRLFTFIVSLKNKMVQRNKCEIYLFTCDEKIVLSTDSRASW